MAETKITCPVCFSEERCFEDKQEQNGQTFSSYMCFKCGYTSNSVYKYGTPELQQVQTSSTQLMNDVCFYDEDREIMWFPTVLNMGQLGVIYPEGTENNWVYKFAQVRKLTELEKKDPKYEGHEQMLDVEEAKEYGQYEFLDACKEMGIIKDLDGNS